MVASDFPIQRAGPVDKTKPAMPAIDVAMASGR